MKKTILSATGLCALGLLNATPALGQAAADVDCDGCVDASDIAAGSIKNNKIQQYAVQSDKIAKQAVTSPKIAIEAVTTGKIRDGAVTADKIAADAVGISQIDPTQVQIRVAGSCAPGSFVTTVNENGSMTCETGAFVFYNSRYGLDALASNTNGWYNTANGHNTLVYNTIGHSNTAIGAFALLNNLDGNNNTAIGDRTLADNFDGNANTALGANALRKNTTGHNNLAIGVDALKENITGHANIAIGNLAGSAVTDGTGNIYIDNSGAASETYTIRIGTWYNHSRTFIAGIRGVTTGVDDAQVVMIDSNGQLGTISSSARYKEDIQDMAGTSERLLQLRPVVFRYKQAYRDGQKPVHYGLIAEEVAEEFPELVVYDENGQPLSVKYHILSTLLLNELQKQADKISDLERLEAEVAELRQLVSQMAPTQAEDTDILLTDNNQ